MTGSLPAGCTCGAPAESTPTTTEAPRPPVVPVTRPTGPIPRDVRLRVVQQICQEGECGGELAAITVWRSPEDGTPARLVYTGSMQTCSHPLTRYYDPSGGAVGVNSDEPFDPGNPSAVASRETHLANTEGLRRGELIRCEDIPPP